MARVAGTKGMPFVPVTPLSRWERGSKGWEDPAMRGRRPAGPEYTDKVAGSHTAKERAQVILETMLGTCRVQEACARLGLSEQRFHQLREDMMTGAVKALEPGHAGRPPQIATPAEQHVAALEQQLAEHKVELQAAKAREEIALILPKVQHEPAEPEKKTPQLPRRRRRRRPGKKKHT
jgi:hypothetical protein